MSKMRAFQGVRRAAVGILALGASSSVTLADLGAFETPNGYTQPGSIPVNAWLVQNYNAGQAPGPYAPIAPNSGLWRELSPGTNGYALVSTDGNHTPGGTVALDLRGGNNSNILPGSSVIDGQWTYTLDTSDLGVAPSSINNNRIITMSWYYRGGVGDVGDTSDTFRMGMFDSSASGGVGFGLSDTSFLTYRDATGWHSTSQFMDANAGAGNAWTYVRVVMDLQNDTFDMGITPGLAPGVMIPDATAPATWLVTGTPMGAGGMNDLTSIYFWVDSETAGSGLGTGVFGSNKSLLDDFHFNVREIPGPGAAGTLGLLLIRAARRKR